MHKEDLERVINTKVKPIVDKAMQDFLGMTIAEIEADISDKLKHTPLIDFEITTDLQFKKAKKLFKKQYLAKLCRLHSGNVSEVANVAGVDRRSVHRLVKECRIGVANIREETQEYNKKTFVQDVIEDVITPYKTSINPTKFKALYKQTPTLSTDIAKLLPELQLNLKEAETQFEKQYLKKTLEENKGNIAATTQKVGLRYETLHRKLRKLGLLQRQ